MDAGLLSYAPSRVCRIRVLDAKALGDPGLLGTVAMSLTEAQLQPNAGPRNSWMPLKVRQLPHHMLTSPLNHKLTGLPYMKHCHNHVMQHTV